MTLAHWAKGAAMRLHLKFHSDNVNLRRVPFLGYSGMSGIAYATALRLALHDLYPTFPVEMVYVRKTGEKSHGAALEFSTAFSYHANRAAVFVDDFIDSGATFKHVRKAFRARTEELNYVITGIAVRDELIKKLKIEQV
jgi:orotate phosphoribosyltransferase-like protein